MPYKDRQGRTCGFLDVEAVDQNRFLRRYFILNRHVNKLHYYLDNPQNLPPRSQPVGSIGLSYVSQVDDAVSSRPKLRFGFFVEVTGQRHYLCANDQDDINGWVYALREATKVVLTKPTVPIQQPADPDAGIPTDEGYRAEVCGGVLVKTPLEGTKSSQISSSEKSDAFTSSQEDSGTFCYYPSKIVDASSYRISAKYASDSDYDSSCDESAGINHLTKAISFTTAPIKTGYCTKQGWTVKTWKKRYFILDEEGVSYFKTHFEKCPIRTIHRTDIVEARISVGIHHNRDHLFEIVTSSRVFYIQAPTLEERDSWISFVNRTLVKGRLKNKNERKSVTAELLASKRATKNPKNPLHRHSSVL